MQIGPIKKSNFKAKPLKPRYIHNQLSVMARMIEKRRER